MAKALTFIGATLAAVHPTVDGSQQITALDVTLNIRYQDLAGSTVMGSTEPFDGWTVLSSAQKVAMQDIRDTIVAAVAAAYLT